jgi:hypothetical protein
MVADWISYLIPIGLLQNDVSGVLTYIPAEVTNYSMTKQYVIVPLGSISASTIKFEKRLTSVPDIFLVQYHRIHLC